MKEFTAACVQIAITPNEPQKNISKCIEWLDKAVETKDGGLSEILSEKLFSNLHDDPRWLPFLRRINYAPEQLAEIQFDVSLPQL